MPETEAELLERAREIAGLTLGELAARSAASVPAGLLHAKGWVGQLLERALGASAGSRKLPDFPALGVELKSLPVDLSGKALESTFVCTIDLLELDGVSWEDSWVRAKLSRVLWIPVDGRREVPVASRRLGSPLLWSPDPAQERALADDWGELASMIARGQTELISARIGACLQVRPKARNAAARRMALDEDGAAYAALPRGFYLRARFTTGILARGFHRHPA